ncbi:MAG: ribosome maturation factor RimM [Kiloniellales bacterium]|nr:ribosome maturation factor RimM [Kiloniellales bacterium]
MAEPRVCLGVFVGAHGVRGLVKVKSFTEEPEAVADYGTLSDESGARQFSLTVTGQAKGVVLARVEGIADRDQAQALRGTRLYVPRAALPRIEEDDSFYHADLIGLEAVDPDGRPVGQVKAVQNFGAGDLIEVATAAGAALLLPFTKAVVPEIDLEAGRLVVVPPQEIEAPPPRKKTASGRAKAGGR